MYHYFVRRTVQSLFDAINRGTAARVLAGFSYEFEHVCAGSHALSGKRTRVGPMLDWYGRMYRLLPDIHFQVTRISVSGAPWNTLVLAEWRMTTSGTDGVPTSGDGAHLFRRRWGRMVQVIICPYGEAFSAPLERLARAGVTEAAAPPIG